MRPISEARRQSMRKIALAVATILVFSGTMFAKVTEAQSQMVNGQVTFENGQATGALPGKLLRFSQAG